VIISRQDAAPTEKFNLLISGHGAWRHFIGQQACSLWERLSASIRAAGKPLPQKKMPTCLEVFGD
jgi:hypothetical protein